jgi:hypothetical protein
LVQTLVSCLEFGRSRDISGQRVRQLLAAGRIEGALRIGGRWAIPMGASIRHAPAGRPARTRLGILRQAARACDAALAAAGVRALVAGSLAYGGVHPRSDLDLLIVSEAAQRYGVPVDTIFADTLPSAVRRAMLKDALRASDI